MRKFALLTGASGGIGKEVAKRLAGDGYSLYLHYNQNKEEVDMLVNELTSRDVEVYRVQADLSDADGVQHLLGQIHHSIDVIIHNSGKSYFGLLTDMTNDTIERMVRLHITSPVMITRELLPRMISKKAGKIVMITSVWGAAGASCEVLYSTVKGGQNSFVKALAKEVAPSGINVNGVAPGVVDTKMMDTFSEDDKQGLKEEIPMGRFAQPAEIANAVSFLVSDESSYISGQIVSVDGAWN